jgi:predicted CoA-substrate-specific enzyme activase
VPFAHKRITEITCHGRGAHELNTETRTIIDIGGQDTKAIQLSAEGAVLDFVMNDKCAAGTGRFLEVMAKTLETDLSQMGPLGLQFNKIVNISSVCTVFAESEVVSLIAKGEAKEDIINGLHDSISERVISLAKRVHKGGLITMTGGVAKNPGVVHSLEKLLDTKLYIPEEPQIVGALGAALFARDRGIKE